MVSKANRRADEAELRLQQERERNEQLQQERHELMLDEIRAMRRQAAALPQPADVE